jgi:hypothetical protein
VYEPSQLAECGSRAGYRLAKASVNSTLRVEEPRKPYADPQNRFWDRKWLVEKNRFSSQLEIGQQWMDQEALARVA